MGKATRGHFFEDFSIGMTLRHPTPRTLHGGDLSLYTALTGDRRPLHASAEFAQSLGFEREVVHDLVVFHVVFGKTVDQVSLNAVANLGYADVRFLRPVYPGDTLRAESEVIGLREVSSGEAGVVYVRTRGFNQKNDEVLSFVRWVLVRKRDPSARTGAREVPELPEAVAAEAIPVPARLNLQRFGDLTWATGSQHVWEDYQVGERIDHLSGMTIDEADHTLATRLYQNAARVHFDERMMRSSSFGRRLVYGGHVISVAHALAFNGLENVLHMAAWNSGSHAHPTFAGDTLYAYTEVLDKAELADHANLGALRLRLVAVKNADPAEEDVPLRAEEGGAARYDERVVLDLDYWGLIPLRGS
jgi:2-methylfumaryl-CoA hydratase